MFYPVEPLAIPMAEEVGESNTRTNVSFTAHVYGAPLGSIRACIRGNGPFSSKLCAPKFNPAEDVSTLMGTFDNVAAYFTWSNGHMDRGNLFGKATWTFSGDSSHEHFQKADFVLRIENHYNDRQMRTFVFNSEGRDQARFCPCNEAASNDLGELS